MSKIPLEKRRSLQIDQTAYRSLEQLETSSEFVEQAGREFPENASEWTPDLSRRGFLQIMGASVGLAGLQACRRPVEKILPYVQAPETLVPGIAQNYASTFVLGAQAYGVLVESHEGRPTKIEGNPSHPYSQGSSNSWMQASVLDLYDPDRSKEPQLNRNKKTWADFEKFASAHFKACREKQGKGFVVWSETLQSPTLLRLQEKMRQDMPQAMWVSYDPINEDAIVSASLALFGKPLRTHYHLEQSKLIVSLGSDFLGGEGAHIRMAKGFAVSRDLEKHDKMSRLYAMESMYTVTGAAADHRLRVKQSILPSLVARLVYELFVVRGLSLPAGLDAGVFKVVYSEFADDSRLSPSHLKWIRVLADDLLMNKGQAIVVPGVSLSAEVHLSAHVLNLALDGLGKTFDYTHVPDSLAVEQKNQVDALLQILEKNQVETMVFLGGNPSFNLPGQLGISRLIERVPNKIRLGDKYDETSSDSHWHLPRAHYLETWGDALAYDGTASFVQPLIAPLYGAKTDSELLAMLLGLPDQTAYALVRETWQKWHAEHVTGLEFEKFWRRSLHDGVVQNSTEKNLVLSELDLSHAKFGRVLAGERGYEVVFAGSSQLYDGRFANNPWLQELPDAMTKLTWDNAVLVSPATAKELGVQSQDVLKIKINGQTLEMPVWVQPGQADESLGVAFGFGSLLMGQVAKGSGVNVFPLRSWNQPYCISGLDRSSFTKAGRTYSLSCTQDHHYTEDRPLVLEGNFARGDHLKDVVKEKGMRPHLISLYQEHEKKGNQWGMVIDLNKCIGCNACMVACQSENNIPVVGKEQVKRGREMHWIRLDRYFVGKEKAAAVENPHVVHQPMACVQCENAPCEQVCPVGATTHSPEGLNDMAYNRCIGTRYCANNCPYKVRRFNFLDWHKGKAKSLDLQHNPNVTVRMLGVMEKCNYCVQRINQVKIKTKVAGRTLQDGDVVSACAQACPSGAITFGNIADSSSRVAKLKTSLRNYDLLAEFKYQATHFLFGENQKSESCPG